MSSKDKIEQLQKDIAEIQEEVQRLRDDFIRRQLMYKIGLYALGAIGTFTGWFLNHVYR